MHRQTAASAAAATAAAATAASAVVAAAAAVAVAVQLRCSPRKWGDVVGLVPYGLILKMKSFHRAKPKSNT